MLKVNLACKNVLKAAGAGPKVAWVRKALVNEGGKEWRGVRATLEDVAGDDLAQCDAIVLTSGLLDAVRLTIELALGEEGKATDCTHDVFPAVTDLLNTLASLYESQTWAPASVLALAHTVVSTRFRSERKGARTHAVMSTGLYEAAVCFCCVAVRANRAGNVKHINEQFLAAPYFVPASPSTSLLAMLMYLRESRLIAAFVFSRPQEWTSYFVPTVTEEEVARMTGMGEAAAVEDKGDKEKDKSSRGGKREALGQLFTNLAAVLAKDEGAGMECVLDAFQATQRDHPVTVLRMVRKLLSLAKYSSATLAALLRVLRVSGVYHSQQDILYHFSFGFSLLKNISLMVTANDAAADATIECGECLLQVYHKVLEPDLGWYISKAVAVGSERSMSFVQQCFTVYADMQSLDVVLGAIVRSDDVMKACPPWLLDIYKTSLPRILDAVPTVKMVLERMEGADGGCEVQACRTLAALALGLHVTDTLAGPAAMWVDEVVDYAYTCVVKGANPSSLPRGTLDAVMYLYHSVQNVLDDASPSFLLSDIFVWSRRSIEAFRLGDASDPVIISFPSGVTITLSALRELCVRGDAGDVLSAALCAKLLLQHIQRAHRHRCVLAASEAAEGEDKKLLKKLKKELKVCCGALVDLWGTVVASGGGAANQAAAVWTVSELLCGSLYLIAEYTDAAGVGGVLTKLLDDAPQAAATGAAATADALHQSSLWDLFPGGNPAAITATHAAPTGSLSALVVRVARSEETWECAPLAAAVRNIIAGVLTDARANLYTFACELLSVFPMVVLKNADDLLDAICKADAACGDVSVRSLLRRTLARVAAANPSWCEGFLETLQEWIVQAELTGTLAPATLAVGVVCLQCSPEPRAIAFCTKLAKRMIKRGKLSDAQHALGCTLIGTVVLGQGGDGWQPLQLAPNEVAALKKMSRKRKRDAHDDPAGKDAKKRKKNSGDAEGTGKPIDDAAAKSPLQQLFSLLAGLRTPWKVLNAALLVMLSRGCSAGADDDAALRRRMVKQSLKGFGEGHDACSEWFLTVALEFAATSLPADDLTQYFSDIYEKLTQRPRAAAPLAASGTAADILLLLRTHRVDTDSVEGVFLSKLPLLSKAGREVVVKRVLSHAAAHLTERTSHLAVAHTFLLTCPKEYTTAPQELTTFVMSAISALHSFAVTAAGRPAVAESMQTVLALTRVVSASCLMEKLPLHGSAIPLLLTLPRLLLALPPSVELFYIVTNILVNVNLHRLEEIEKHWSAYVHAVGDVIEGLLAWVTCDELAAYAKDMVIETVRLVVLFSGAVRRPGVTPATKERIQHHAPLFLQRFLSIVVKHPSAANAHNRELSRAFTALMGTCGKEVFAMTYAQIPQVCRTVAAAYHLQWQSSRFQGKT